MQVLPKPFLANGRDLFSSGSQMLKLKQAGKQSDTRNESFSTQHLAASTGGSRQDFPFLPSSASICLRLPQQHTVQMKRICKSAAYSDTSYYLLINMDMFPSSAVIEMLWCRTQRKRRGAAM